MPQKRNEAPKVMTWGKAAPILIVAALFDLVRIFFEWFWFFGPALAAVACTAGVNSAIGASITSGIVGKAVALGCSAAAGVAGFYGVEATETFGAVMAMAVGLFGWLVIGVWLMRTNSRIFKENTLWFISSLGIAEIPFIGTIPSFSLVLWRIHHVQIKKDKAVLARYEKEKAAGERLERERRIAELMQTQVIEPAPEGIY